MHTLGGITRARRNLRQLFLHPRAANGEADKVVEPIFDLCPGHRAVAPPAGPNDEADLCVTTHFLRNLLDNFEGTFAGNGKKRVLFCPDKTPRLNAAESVHVCVFVLLCANSLILKRPILLNNYVTPVLN